MEGLVANDNLGYSVSAVGDINGDGKADLVLGAPGFNFPNATAGKAYVMFGKTTGWPAVFNLTTLDGTNGFQINGLDAMSSFGHSVSTAGDINGDGKADLVLGAVYADVGSIRNAGTVYVLFGKPGGFPATFNLATLNGTNGFKVQGLASSDVLGASVSSAGDINGDGRADLVLGAPQTFPGERTQAGTAYIIFGQASGFPAAFNLTITFEKKSQKLSRRSP